METEKINYKSFVGPAKIYDMVGIIQFGLLAYYGLKSKDKVLDVGCGALRLGKYLIPFLKEGNYYGIEPNMWLVEQALKYEINNQKKQKAHFSNISDFNLKIFKKQFDWIIANSIFIHASLNQIEKCLKNAQVVMKDKTIFFFNYIEGKDNKKSEWSYPEAVTYKKETLQKLAKRYNMYWEDINWYYPGKQKWVKLYNVEMEK